MARKEGVRVRALVVRTAPPGISRLLTGLAGVTRFCRQQHTAVGKRTGGTHVARHLPDSSVA